MKILIIGNLKEGLAKAVAEIFKKNGHHCHGVSRSNGYDFEPDPISLIHDIAELSLNFDVFINLYSNFFFNSSILAHKVFHFWYERGFSNRLIINIGSTTDRVTKEKTNLYHYEKKALREISTGFGLLKTLDNAPKVTYISFGTMENRSEDHPNRKCLTLNESAEYIYWLTQQPDHIHINELSIDPLQNSEK